MTQTHRIWSLAQAIIDKAGAEGVMVASAESCTGGMITAALTDVPGSSAVVERGFVTYTNEAKTEMLGVPASVIAPRGAAAAARVERRVFADGSRDFVRTKATETALHLMLTALQTAGTPD